jgi:hypothetical protein
MPLARSGAGEIPAPLRVTLPCRWAEGGLVGFAGRVRFTRHFGYPGRIDDFERVWLTADGVESVADLTLNGTAVGRYFGNDKHFEAEITPLMRERNELIVDVTGPENGGLWGEVALEVRCQAFLRGVRVEVRARTLQIQGSVVGPAEGRLELYAVLGRRTAAYATVAPSPDGTPFSLTADIPSLATEDASPVLKLDLVNGASVWYTFEQAWPDLAELKGSHGNPGA